MTWIVGLSDITITWSAARGMGSSPAIASSPPAMAICGRATATHSDVFKSHTCTHACEPRQHAACAQARQGQTGPSRTRMLPSLLPESKREPSGEKQTALT